MALSLTAKTFTQYREELLKYIQTNFPDLLSAFGNSDIGQLLIELQAGIADSLSYHIDKALMETQIEYAQERKSLLALAKNMGLKIGGKTPALTLVDFSFIIPAKGDSFDNTYLPIIKTGTQVVGGGQVFEVYEDIDFANPLSNYGVPNIKYIPLFNNNTITSYQITKRELIFNGKSKQYKKRVVNSSPFYSIILPDKNVISVEQIIVKNINQSNPETLNISDFFNENERFYEVDYLAQSQIFMESQEKTDENIKKGVWVEKTKKFITETTSNNYTKIIFGNGDNIPLKYDLILSEDKPTLSMMNVLLNNQSLGEKIPDNSDIYIRYRVGGGSQTNVGQNVLNQLGFASIVVNGANNSKNEEIKRTLRVNNPIPALGGKDEVTNDYLRYLIQFNSTQPLNFIKYYTKVLMNMNGKFGSPFKIAVIERDNKILVYLLGLTETNKLSNANSNVLKQNIAEYLSNFRNLNDYIEILDAKIINLGIKLTLFVDSFIEQNFVANEVIQKIKNIFDITKSNINSNIYVGEIFRQISTINGVINIMSLSIYNKVDLDGIEYSPSKTSMKYLDETEPTNKKYSKEILIENNTLYTNYDEMFEIRYPEKDIEIVLKKSNF